MPTLRLEGGEAVDVKTVSLPSRFNVDWREQSGGTFVGGNAAPGTKTVTAVDEMGIFYQVTIT